MTTTLTKPKKTSTKLERYLMDVMFEKSLFSDLSLVFIHPSFPFSMRFNVHKSIISQSPFLCKLLENMDNISLDQQDQQQSDDSQSEEEAITSLKPKTSQSEGGITSLTIDLAKALTHCGFILAPFQHIVRRKWQKTTNTNNDSSKRSNKDTLRPLRSSHIRFVLQWLYCLNKQELIKTMQDEDTLRILSVAVLLDVHDLTQACVNRYTTQQLSLTSIMRDLETICQLPRGHRSYLQLRDAALLLLFRYGPENATRLAELPVDYMADVLSADPLFVNCEFERYCLLRAVLMAFMQSVGKITWTPKGPVDQDAKRLSGFVRPLQPTPKILKSGLTADTVRSRKRKRIPSEDLEDPVDALQRSTHLNRLSFTALVPFEKLVADASSGGVIDKATVLSYLLRTTVNYSNMTFDQLTTVRQDGIVDEGIVFRALWQREALERVLFPLTYHQQTQEQDQQENQRRHTPIAGNEEEDDDERNAALDEYFDVDDSDAQEKRRRLLLGTPRFRFRSSVYITPPSEENGWECEDKEVQYSSAVDLSTAFDDEDESDGSLWSESDNEETPIMSTNSTRIDELEIGNSPDRVTVSSSSAQATTTTRERRRKSPTKTTKPYKLYKKTFYSDAETILGISYRVQIEAQVMPRHRLHIQDEQEDSEEELELYADHNADENIIVCRFELQRDMKQIALPPPIPIKKEKDTNNKRRSLLLHSKPLSTQSNIPRLVQQPSPSIDIPLNNPSTTTRQPPQQQQRPREDVREKTKIHYWIHCLNRHDGILENDRIDPEDRVLVAVTEQCEREHGEPGEMEPGYVGQVLVEADLKKGVTIDATVALEIFGFQKV